MRRNDRAAQTIRDQIAVVHTSAPDHPRGLIRKATHNKGMQRLRQNQRFMHFSDLDLRPTGRGLRTDATHFIGHVATQPQLYWRSIASLIQSQRHAMTRKYGDLRIISRIDHIHLEPDFFSKKRDIRTNITRWAANFSFDIAHRISFGRRVCLSRIP